MINTFPELLTYGLLAPLILRLAAGLVFVNLGYLKLTAEKDRWRALLELPGRQSAELLVKILAAAEIVGGLMLILGLRTQLAALVLAVLTFGELWLEYQEENLLKRNLVFYLLLFAISLSLLFSGAGFLAFDWPL